MHGTNDERPSTGTNRPDNYEGGGGGTLPPEETDHGNKVIAVKLPKALYKEVHHRAIDPEIVWRKDMGVEWMHRYEAREAIPPVFTEYLGKQLLAQMEVAA